MMQADDSGDLHAVRYGPYATTKHQSNYSADDLEATALMYALKSVEWLAQCRKTTVITDNAHVLHLKDWTLTNRRQKRMLAYLQQFHLSVLFIKGSKNLLPDALSRLYQDASVQERKEHEAKFVYEIDDFILPVTTRSANRAALKTPPNARDVLTSADDAADSSALSPYAAPYFPQRLIDQYSSTDGGEILDDSEQYNLPMVTLEQQNAWVDVRAPQYNAMDLDEDSHRDVTYTDMDGNGQTGTLEPAEPQTHRNNLKPHTLEPSNHSQYIQNGGIGVGNRQQPSDVERGNYIASGDDRDPRSPTGSPADAHRHTSPPHPVTERESAPDQLTGAAPTPATAPAPALAPAPAPVSAPAPGAAADQTSRATDTATDTQPPDSSSEARYTDNNTAVNFPTITPPDYQTDEEFRNMFTYLMFGELTGNMRVDKQH